MDFRMIFFTFSFWTDVAKIKLLTFILITFWLDDGAEFARICKDLTGSAKVYQGSAKFCQVSAKNQLVNDCIYTPS